MGVEGDPFVCDRQELLLCAVMMETFAVMPGRSFNSELSTPITVSYVITFWFVWGALRIWIPGSQKGAQRKGVHGEN